MLLERVRVVPGQAAPHGSARISPSHAKGARNAKTSGEAGMAGGVAVGTIPACGGRGSRIPC
jgi:hypothetical protein